MPTQEQVWKAADDVLARGEEPVRMGTVLAELRSYGLPGEASYVGGTERTVGPQFKSWKVVRDYTPRPRIESLPERLQDDHAKFVKAVWAAATEEADARMEDERRTLAAETRANDAPRVEAMIETDAARTEAAGLRTETEALRAENTTLRYQVARLREPHPEPPQEYQEGDAIRAGLVGRTRLAVSVQAQDRARRRVGLLHDEAVLDRPTGCPQALRL